MSRQNVRPGTREAGGARLNARTPERLEQMRELFPDAFPDGLLDWDRLRAALGDGTETRPERYALTWAGKREALRALHSPSGAELVPQPQEGIDAGTTEHRFLEGDNLEVLKLLEPTHSGRVKLIYIDPPYNTGNEFLYPDRWSEGRRQKAEGSGDGAPAQVRALNPSGLPSAFCLLPSDPGGRYHATWLSMIYPRLLLAHRLLRPDGFLCVSIGEEELANLRLLLNEVFSEENYRNTILVRRTDKNLNRQFIARGLMTLNVGAEYVLIYARSPKATLRPVYRPASERRQHHGYWKGFWNAADRPTMRYDILGVTPANGQWKWKREVAAEAVRNYEEYQRAYAQRMTLEEYWAQTEKGKRFIRRNPKGKGKNQGVEHWIPPSSGILRSSNWCDLLASGMPSGLSIDLHSPKNVLLLKELIRMCGDENGLVLDFFAGSCTTAQAVLELNHEDGGRRRFLMVQLPVPTGNPDLPTICDIGKERIRRVIERLKQASPEEANRCEDRLPADLGFQVCKLRVGSSPEVQGE